MKIGTIKRNHRNAWIAYYTDNGKVIDSSRIGSLNIEPAMLDLADFIRRYGDVNVANVEDELLHKNYKLAL